MVVEMLKRRGYHAVYREGEKNVCPGCGRTHWILGRMTAECGFCATAVELDFARRTGHRDRPGFFCRGNGEQTTRQSLHREKFVAVS